MISPNNLSRKLFSSFVERNLVTMVDRRNVFDDAFGKRYAFCVINRDDDSIECRQFYSDCDAIVCLNLASGMMTTVDRKHLIVQKTANRKTDKGIAAYTAKCNFGFAKQAMYNKPKCPLM